jgi:hypothetical protein
MSTIELLESVAAELVRAYGEGNASYDDVLNYLNGII